MSQYIHPNGSISQGQVPEEGAEARLGIIADVVVFEGAGRVATVTVLVAGSAAGGVHDVASAGAAAAANQVAVIPNAVGIYKLNWPIRTACVIKVGTGQTIAVSYSKNS